MNVEFGTPEGYVEPTHSVATQPVIADPRIVDLPPAVRVPLAVDAFIPFRSPTPNNFQTLVHSRRCDSGDNRDIICSSLK
jgi:hypothetical protein